jgi:proteasome lid subunit RPN8/RPN11
LAEKPRPRRISLSSEIQIEIESHANSRLDAEVGGMLFGQISGSKTEILGFVPALTASAEQISLTFTHDVWEEILREGHAKYPDMTIVGWYHTHPTFGIFLSEYDEFIQKNFFSLKGQLALVIDPIAGSLGWFDLDSKGRIRSLNLEKTRSGPQSTKQRDVAIQKSQSQPRLSLAIALSAGALTVGSAITAGILLSLMPPDQREQVASLRQEKEVANMHLFYTESWLAETMNVRMVAVDPASSLEDILKQLAVDPAMLPEILRLNPQATPGGMINTPILFLPITQEVEIAPEAEPTSESDDIGSPDSTETESPSPEAQTPSSDSPLPEPTEPGAETSSPEPEA